MQKVFYSPHFKRDITISISKRDIDFIFSNLVEDFCFYDVPISEWRSKYAEHLRCKKWFTLDMDKFITQNVPL